jgi:hypothetical protein
VTTPRCTLTCPSCGTDIPIGVLYGPCAACRRQLNANADTTFAAKLERVADALADGWTCDDARCCWVRLEPCGHCDGTGYANRANCRDCKGTGHVEVLVEWVA